MEFYAFNLPLIQHNLSKCSRCVGGKIIQTGVEAPKNGYVYVYVSNESNNLVYFDNFVISHTRGPVLSENHYYPFGVTMAGISSQAALTMANKYKFNAGTELNEDLNVDYYETFFRNYDAQIGRFNGVDILSEKYAGLTSYQFAANNPISFNDPMGDQLRDPLGQESNVSIGNLQPNLSFGRMQRGPDGNYHVGWLSDLMYGGNSDWWESGGGGGGSGRVQNISAFFRSIRNLFSQGYQIAAADIFTSKRGNLFGTIGYYAPGNEMNDGGTLAIALNYSANSGNYQIAGFGFGQFADHSAQMMNAGAVMYGAGEIASRQFGQYSKGIGAIFGNTAEQTSEALSKFGKTLGGWGKNLGTAGVVLSGFNIGTKLFNGEHVSAGEVTNFGISTVLVVGASIAAGTVAAPFIAVASLVYGIGELGSWLFTRKTLEENIFGK